MSCTRDTERLIELQPFARAEAEDPGRWEQVLQTLLVDSTERASGIRIRLSGYARQWWLRPAGSRDRVAGHPPPSQTGADPMQSLLAALSPVDLGTRLIAQLVLAPAPRKWARRTRRRIEQLRQEERDQAAQRGGTLLPVLLALGLLGWAFWSDPPVQLPGLLALGLVGLAGLLLLLGCWSSWLRQRERDLLWLDQEPLRQQALRVQLRLLAINSLPAPPPTPGSQGDWRQWWQRWQQARRAAARRRAALARLLAAYRQFEWLGATVRPRRLTSWELRRLLRPGGWRGPHLRLYGWDLLPASTVAALWHVPAQLPPLLARHSYRILPAPPSLLALGGRPVALASLGPSLGQETVTVPWPASIFDGHLAIVGRSGEGKSTALLQLALEALYQEKWGLAVIDPHDLVDQLLPLIPPDRAGDVVLMDLSDPEHVPGINPLDVHFSPVRDKAVADLLACFREIWATTWGPRMEAACEAALKLLYSVNQQLVRDEHEEPWNQLTLLEVLPVLTSESVRRRLLRFLRDPDPLLVRWWAYYFDPLGSWMKLERVDPVLTKFTKFEQLHARRILSQGRSVDLRKCLGRILLVKLAPSTVGEDTARLLGATLLNLLGLYIQEQPPGRTPKGTLVIIDEFQWFLGARWSMLAELRKFGARFALATQSLDLFRQESQDRKLLAQLLANVQTLIAFASSAHDADLLARELGVEAADLQTLTRHHCYARLPLAGERITCSLRFLLPEAADAKVADQVRASAARYCRSAQEIDRELAERQQWLLWGERATRSARALPEEPEPGQEEGRESVSASLEEESEEVAAPARSRGSRSKRGRKGPRQRRETFRTYRNQQMSPLLFEVLARPVADEREPAQEEG